MKKHMCPCSSNRKKPMRKQAVVKKVKKVVKKKVKKNNISNSEQDKLLKHARLHAGGMRSDHMKIMVKEMKRGETFGKAHKIAMKG